MAVELVASVAVGEEAGTGRNGGTCSAMQVMWELEVAWARSAQANAWWSAPAGFIDRPTGSSGRQTAGRQHVALCVMAIQGVVREQGFHPRRGYWLVTRP